MAAQKQLLTDRISGISYVPADYVRAESDRPSLGGEVEFLDGSSIPVIDLQGLDGHDRSGIVQQIGQACQDYGFFQIKNHGVPDEVIDGMLRVAREFFHLPESERLKSYSDDPMKTTRLSTSFNVKTEKVSNWRDFLRLHCHPLEDYVQEWPNNPPSFREDVADYCRNVRKLGLRLLEAISESLGLERDYIDGALGSHGQHLAINYYPPCPQPELTYGLPAHADPNVITLLLQDEVLGLQVLRNGEWVAVKSIPYTFIVNVGDQIQVISNDGYKSVLHRAVVNSCKERISIPTFYCPSADAIIEPAQKLADDDAHPPLYTSFPYIDYYRKFWNRGLASHTCLDFFRTLYHKN